MKTWQELNRGYKRLPSTRSSSSKNQYLTKCEIWSQKQPEHSFLQSIIITPAKIEIKCQNCHQIIDMSEVIIMTVIWRKHYCEVNVNMDL